MLKKRFAVLFLLISIVLTSGCGAKKYTEYDYGCFDTVTAFTAAAESNEEFDVYKELVFSELKRYDALFDIYAHHDGCFNLYDLNHRTDPSEPAETDPEITELLTFCKKAYELTEGKVNCAMGAILSLWHEARETNILPDRDKLSESALSCNIDDLVIEGNTVRFLNSSMTVDVGASAKGFACQKIAEKLKQEGCKAFVLSMGGNVVTCGTNNGKSWKVGVQSSSGDSLLTVLESSDEAIVTSGGYNRFVEIDGKTYHHIIDPDTLYPCDKMKSVTVIAASSAYADVLSTYLFQLDTDNALETAEKLGVKIIIEDNSGNILYSKGLSN